MIKWIHRLLSRLHNHALSLKRQEPLRPASHGGRPAGCLPITADYEGRAPSPQSEVAESETVPTTDSKELRIFYVADYACEGVSYGPGRIMMIPHEAGGGEIIFEPDDPEFSQSSQT